MKIVWTPKALKMLDEYSDYLIEHWGGIVLMELIDRIERISILLKKNPLMYPLIDQEKQLRRVVLDKYVSILYRIEPNRIRVMTLLYNRAMNQP